MEYIQKKKLLRLPEVISRTGYKRSNIYQLMNLGDFPKSVQLGLRAVAWLSSEIDQWIDDRVKERDQKLSIESSIGQKNSRYSIDSDLGSEYWFPER